MGVEADLLHTEPGYGRKRVHLVDEELAPERRSQVVCDHTLEGGGECDRELLQPRRVRSGRSSQGQRTLGGCTYLVGCWPVHGEGGEAACDEPASVCIG